jgi:hypothetical protein
MITKLLILIVLVGFSLPGQITQIPAAAGSGSSSPVTTTASFAITRTSSTVLTINGECASSTPCVFRYGGVATRFTANATITLSAAASAQTVYIYGTSAGSIIAAYNTGVTMSCSAGCTVVSGISAFPYDSIPFYTWVAGTTANTWDSSGTDYRALLSTAIVDSGTGITVTPSGVTGRLSVAIDPTVTGQITTGGTYASKPATCTEGSLYLPTNSLYQMLLCGASNVWYHHVDGKRIGTLLSTLSWTNVTGGTSETGTVTETYGYTTLNGTALTQLAPWTRYASAPSAPYVRTWLIRAQIPADNYGAVYVGWRDSSTTLMQSIWLGYSGGTVTNGLFMKVFRQNADGSGSSDDVTTSGTVAAMASQLNGSYFCLRTEDNNTNRIFSFSNDCNLFTVLHTETRTTYVANPNQLVMGLYGTGTANQPPIAHFMGFLE